MRALTPAEVRELLDPVLGTLSWLHIQGLVHGGLKPSNIMVIQDQVKLSVDRIQPAGPSGAPFPASGIYDAPGAADKMSPAADVWSLGVLLVEALTQHPPKWDRDSATDPPIPPSVPEPFASIARECLHRDPARRCSLSQILSQLAPVPDSETAAKNGPTSSTAVRPPAFPVRPPTLAPHIPPPASAIPPPLLSDEPAPPAKTAAQRSLDQSINIFATAALILIIAVAALTFILPARHSAPPRTAKPSSPSVERSSPAVRPAAPPHHSGVHDGPMTPGAVLHRAMPAASQGALNTIRGHVVVGVRVQVGPDGNVSAASLESAGPSRYFARVALDAAHDWKFRPAQVGGRPVSSAWLLHFGFARTGTDVTPTEITP